MRILYANVIEQHADWGAEVFLNRALQDQGATTYCIDYRNHRRRLVRAFRKAPDCDVFFLQRGEHFPLDIVASIQRPRFFWNSELVSRRPDVHHLLASGLFDRIYLRTEDCVNRVVDAGWAPRERCTVFLGAADGRMYRPAPDRPKDIDVLFIGSMTPRRRAILNALAEEVEVAVHRAFGMKQAELFQRAKIVLNLHAEDRLDTETRIYEALGCGTLVISETLSPENPFSDRALVQVAAVDELAPTIKRYLNAPEERERITAQGARELHANHTYEARARTLLADFTRVASDGGNTPMLRPTMAFRARSIVEPLVVCARLLALPALSLLRRFGAKA